MRRTCGPLVAFLGIGLVIGSLQQKSSYHPHPDRPVEMVLEVSGVWHRDEDGLRTMARGGWMRQGRWHGRWNHELRLVLPRDSSPPASSRLRVRGYLRRPPAPANGLRARPGLWILRVKSMVFVSTDEESGISVRDLLRRASTYARGVIDRRLQRESRGGEEWHQRLIEVLVLGRADQLPRVVARGLRCAGLSHLVALSGLHVGLLVGAVLLLTSGLSRQLRIPIVLLLTCSYVLLAGARPSLIRATLMMVAVLGSWALARPPQAANTLAWVAAIMLIWDTSLMRDLGFQLTVAATAGILILAPQLEERLERVPVPLRKPLSVSVAAHLAALPWALSAFHIATPLSPLWNLVAVPWAALTLGIAFAWVCCSIIAPPLTSVLGEILDQLGRPLDALGALPPGILLAMPVQVGWWAALSLSVLLLTICLAKRWARMAASLGLACGLLLVPGREPSAPELVILDVGQGEAILLRDQDRTLLVDGGGWRRGDIAQRVLVPTLAHLGVRRLDGAILTHPDTDHCGGLLALSSYMKIGTLYTTPGWIKDPCVSELLVRPGLQVRPLWRGEEVRLGRWALRVVHPAAGDRQGRNDRSIVLLATTSEYRVLLTGDLESSGEREILSAVAGIELDRVDILKIGHHGSATSTSREWLLRARPGLALISCGVANRYGHPSPLVLSRLRRSHIPTLRTDRHGAIQITLDAGGPVRIQMPGAPRDLGF